MLNGISVKDYAKQFNCSEQTVIRQIKKGKIEAKKIKTKNNVEKWLITNECISSGNNTGEELDLNLTLQESIKVYIAQPLMLSIKEIQEQIASMEVKIDVQDIELKKLQNQFILKQKLLSEQLKRLHYQQIDLLEEIKGKMSVK